MILMFLQESQPRLHHIRVSVLDLYQPPHGDALEVLLRLLENEVGAWNCPAFDYAGEGNGAARAETHVVGCAHGEVGEEEEVADVVGAQLEVAGGHAVFGRAAQGAHVYGTDVDGGAEGFEGFGGFGVEGGLVGGEGDVVFPAAFVRLRTGN